MKLIVVISLILAGFAHALACTSILVTKGASKDGSTMISYSCDGEFLPHLKMKEAADHSHGEKIKVNNWYGTKGEIKQVAHTYRVVGLMNEHQLTIGETTFEGRKELLNKKGLLNYYRLMLLALERAKTAREAIAVMTALVEEYGYGSTGESFSIADKEEVWIMEMIGRGPDEKGALWAAIKIPDGMICAHANMSRIGEIDFKDKKNVLYSKDLVDFAVRKGYYDPNSGHPFHFSKAFNPPTEEQVRYSARRIWSIFRRCSPKSDFSPAYSSSEPGAKPYPLYIEPDGPLEVKDVMSLHRDHYEGTEFDMTKDLTAGPFGAPDRARPIKWEVDGKKYAWERPISTRQSAYVFVSQSRDYIPDEVGGVYWYGMDNPYTNFYIPLYSSISELPKSFTKGDLKVYSPESAWWVVNFVANFANLRFLPMLEDIQEARKDIEDVEFRLQPAIEKTAIELINDGENDLARLYLTRYCVDNGERATRRWRELADRLIAKYNDGYIQDEKGYPHERSYDEEWLKKEVQINGDRMKMKEERDGEGEL